MQFFLQKQLTIETADIHSSNKIKQKQRYVVCIHIDHTDHSNSASGCKNWSHLLSYKLTLKNNINDCKITKSLSRESILYLNVKNKRMKESSFYKTKYTGCTKKLNKAKNVENSSKHRAIQFNKLVRMLWNITVT